MVTVPFAYIVRFEYKSWHISYRSSLFRGQRSLQQKVMPFTLLVTASLA